MDTFERLRNAAQLTENDRAIISYVIDHPEEVAGLSTRELAERTHTSASAVSRCCQRLGFPSFSVFKANVASDLKAADPGTISLASNERAISALAKSSALYQKIVNDMRQTLSTETLTRVAAMVEDACYVSILALTSNVICAKYAEINLLLAGYVTKVVDDTESISRYSLLAPQDTLAILISRGGVHRPIVLAAGNLKRRGVPTVAITSVPDSILAQTCDEVIGGYSSLQGNLTYAAWNCSTSLITDTLTSMLYSRRIAANQTASMEHYDQYVDVIAPGEHTNTQGQFVGDIDAMWFQPRGENDGDGEPET